MDQFGAFVIKLVLNKAEHLVTLLAALKQNKLNVNNVGRRAVDSFETGLKIYRFHDFPKGKND